MSIQLSVAVVFGARLTTDDAWGWMVVCNAS